MYQWRKGIAQWRVADTLYLSVVFTWHLPRARQIAQQSKLRVVAGGPAVDLMPDYLADVSERGDPLLCELSPLRMHNPLATRTSQGCPNACPWCVNQHRTLVELNEWDCLPVVCDDAFFSCSREHIERSIFRLSRLPMVDFNQGLSAKEFPNHIDLMRQLPLLRLRFAWDTANQDTYVMDAVRLAQSHGMKDIRCYVLVGYNDTPEEAMVRCQTLWDAKVLPNPMRFQPLDALTKNSFVGASWTSRELGRFCRYWARHIHLAAVPYDEYRPPEEGQEPQLFEEARG